MIQDNRRRLYRIVDQAVTLTENWPDFGSRVKRAIGMLQQLRPWLRLEHYDRAMRMPCRFPLTALLLLGVLIGLCGGQESSSATRVQAKRMEIPRYLPLARQAGISGEVDLRLTVNKAGKVVSVEVVSARPDGWGKGFASMAIEAAKKSESHAHHALAILSSTQ
jgi:TonB family protein